MRYRLPRCIDGAVLLIAIFLIVHNVNAPLDTHVSVSDYAARVGDLDKQVGAVILAAYGLLALFFNRQQVFTFRIGSGVCAFLFLAVATASLAWSQSPELSASRWFGMMTVVVAAAAAVKRLGTIDVLRWCFFAELMYLTLGILNELRCGTFQPVSAGYRFHGINDDNSTGTEAVILLFASIAMSRRAPSSWLYRSGIVMAIALMVMTRSRTALVSCIVALGIVYGVIYLRRRARILLLYGVALAGIGVIALTEADFINMNAVMSLGRSDASSDALTGRIPLWNELYEDYARPRIVTGYGYGAFWTRERIEAISRHRKWKVAAAHSIYLDSVLAVGLIGGLLYLLTLAGLLATALKLAEMRKEEGVFWACVLCALLLDGVSDSSPWYIASMYFFMSVQAVFVLCSLDVQRAIHGAGVYSNDDHPLDGLLDHEKPEVTGVLH